MIKATISPEFAVEILNLILQQEQGFVSSAYQHLLGNKSQDVVQWFYLQKEIEDDKN